MINFGNSIWSSRRIRIFIVMSLRIWLGGCWHLILRIGYVWIRLRLIHICRARYWLRSSWMSCFRGRRFRWRSSLKFRYRRSSSSSSSSRLAIIMWLWKGLGEWRRMASSFMKYSRCLTSLLKDSWSRLIFIKTDRSVSNRQDWFILLWMKILYSIIYC